MSMPQKLSDMEEEEEELDIQISVKQKRAILKELDKRGEKGFWRKFSINDKMSGMDWRKALHWIRNS